MMPLSVPAIIARACCCWWGGKKSMMRLIDSGASTVWSVESTRWPVSAADRAVWTVSSSRISPTRIDVRVLAQHAAQGALEGRRVLADLALVDDRVAVAVQELDRVLDRDDVLVHRPVHVVDHRRERGRLAGAGRAGEQDDPALLLGEPGDDGGKVELLDRLDVHGDGAHDDRDGAALVEGVDAEAREALHRVGEVDLVLGLELGELVRRRGASPGPRPSCPAGASGSKPGMGSKLAVEANERRRGDLQVEVRALGRDEVAECVIKIERHTRPSSAGRASVLSALEEDAAAAVRRVLDDLHDAPARAGDLDLLALRDVDRRLLVDRDLRAEGGRAPRGRSARAPRCSRRPPRRRRPGSGPSRGARASFHRRSRDAGTSSKIMRKFADDEAAQVVAPVRVGDVDRPVGAVGALDVVGVARR